MREPTLLGELNFARERNSARFLFNFGGPNLVGEEYFHEMSWLGTPWVGDIAGDKIMLLYLLGGSAGEYDYVIS